MKKLRLLLLPLIAFLTAGAVTISQLPDNPGLTSAAKVEVEQNGSSYRATVAEWNALLTTNVDAAVTAAAASASTASTQATAASTSANTATTQATAAAASATTAATQATAASTSATAAASSATAAAASATAAATSETNAAASAATAASAAGNQTVITSTTSNTLGTGTSKTFGYASQANLAWKVGDRLKIFRTSAPTYWMLGPITAVSSTSVSVTPDLQLNNGTFTDWTLQLVQAGAIVSNPGAGSNSETFGHLSAAAGASGTAVGRSSTAGGSAGAAFGYLANASQSNCTALGTQSAASASLATAVGSSATASGSGSVSIGGGNSATASNAISIGGSVNVTTSNTIGIGTSNSVSSSVAVGHGQTLAATETGAVVIGYAAKASGTVTGGGKCVAIGYGAEATSWRNTVVGADSKCTAVSGTAIGYGVVVETAHGVALGRGAMVPSGFGAAVSLGFNGGDAPTDVYFDNGMYSNYVSIEGLSASLARATASCPVRLNGMAGRDKAGVTGNLSGGNIELNGGQSTGTGTGGSVKLRVSFPGSSGTSLNALTDMVTVSPANGLEVYRTITASGTNGAQTINKPAGRVNLAGSATSLVVTNSMVTANSIVICTVGSNDTTCKSVAAVPTAGSFTIYPDAAPTSATAVNFLVIN